MRSNATLDNVKAVRTLPPELVKRWWWREKSNRVERHHVALWWEAIRRNSHWQERYDLLEKEVGARKAHNKAQEKLHRSANKNGKITQAEFSVAEKFREALEGVEQQIRKYTSFKKNDFLEDFASGADVDLLWIKLPENIATDLRTSGGEANIRKGSHVGPLKLPIDFGKNVHNQQLIEMLSFSSPSLELTDEEMAKLSFNEIVDQAPDDNLRRWAKRINRQIADKIPLLIPRNASPSKAGKELEAFLREVQATHTITPEQNQKPPRLNEFWRWLEIWDSKNILKPTPTNDVIAGWFGGKDGLTEQTVGSILKGADDLLSSVFGAAE